MTVSLADPNNFYHKIYHESCPEFEEVREMCLSENNWLKNIYTKDALVLEKHVGYSVVYYKDTNEPVGMAGLFNDGQQRGGSMRRRERAEMRTERTGGWRGGRGRERD